MMELLCKQYTNELTSVDIEIEDLYEDNQSITSDGLFSTWESALKTNLEGYVTEILKTKEKKFVRDKLAYDNKQAYHWGQKNNKAKRRNNQTQNPKQPTSKPNDSDSSVSSVSSSQAQDTRSTRTQEAVKCTKENVTMGTVRRTRSTKAPMATRASTAKNSSAHAPGHSDVNTSTSLTNTSLIVSPNAQVSNINPVPSQSDFRPAPIFSQPVMDPKQIVSLDLMNLKMLRTSLKW